MILDKIVAHKRRELEQIRRSVSEFELKSMISDLPMTKDFYNSLAKSDRISLIAEVKKKSPSKGIIREDFDPIAIAKIYAENGADAISILTDSEFFAGHLDYLTAIRQAINLPILRKDFTIDPYQIYEARVAGADAILLIVAILNLDQIREFSEIAGELGMASLVEIHTENELEIALSADAKIIGINNRNLRIFKTDLRTTFDLIKKIPSDKIIVSESGINNREDVRKLESARVNAILVGESLMRSAEIGAKVRELIGR